MEDFHELYFNADKSLLLSRIRRFIATILEKGTTSLKSLSELKY